MYLLNYSPENFLEKNVEKKGHKKFIETIFKSKEWLELDKEPWHIENAIEKICRNNSRRKGKYRETF